MDDPMALVEIGPAMVVLGIILAPFGIRAMFEDFSTLAHLIEHPGELEEFARDKEAKR